MNQAIGTSTQTQKQVRWVGPLDRSSPTLGMPLLEGLRKVTLYRAADNQDHFSHHAYLAAHDGTAYIINNPGNGCDPLVISLASDGLTFDRHAIICCDTPPVQFAGVYKGPGFQYPHALINDGMLHVLYSIGKEDMELTSIPLAALERLEPVSASAEMIVITKG